MWLFNRSIKCLLLLYLCNLAACGFALRGAYELPSGMAKTHIQAENSGSVLVGHLRRSLKSAAVDVVEHATPEVALLKIRESSARRVLSVGADSKALEYELQYTVTFSVDMPGPDDELPEQSITLSRDYIFDPLGVLAVNEEEAMLLRDMQRELARMIIERIAAYTRPDTAAGTR